MDMDASFLQKLGQPAVYDVQLQKSGGSQAVDKGTYNVPCLDPGVGQQLVHKLLCNLVSALQFDPADCWYAEQVLACA